MIYAPSSENSVLLKMLRLGLEGEGFYEPPSSVHGYVAGRSIVSNASNHLDRDVVLNVDIENFFPSIDSSRVLKALRGFGLSEVEATLICGVAIVDGGLPAGFSTSPFLSNAVFLDTDRVLEKFAQSRGVSYSRFADDLTFSGSFGDEILESITQLVIDEGWLLNERKTKFMRRGGPQYVTGLYVGDPAGPHLPRRVKRRLRQRLFYMAKYGFDDVAARSKGEAMTFKSANGWLSYLRQVEPLLAQKQAKVLDFIEFGDPPLKWSEPEDWTALLTSIGLWSSDSRGAWQRTLRTDL